MKRKVIITIVTIFVLTLVWVVTHEPVRYMINERVANWTEPEYKDGDNYGTSDGGYVCSKPIKLRRMPVQTADARGSTMRMMYTPVDPDEAKLFCHMTFAIEYKGKLKVLQKPEVLSLISRYPYKDVSIKALEFGLLHSEGFVDRLLPQYRGREIGCIIILETPKEKMVFLEDERLETFEQMDYLQFEEQLMEVDIADKKLFIDNLR